MSIEQIGELAGRIWRTLDEEGELKVTSLKKQLEAPDAQVYLALGWLAREGKLEMKPAGRSWLVRLR